MNGGEAVGRSATSAIPKRSGLGVLQRLGRSLMLPIAAAVLAIYHEARPERKAFVGGVMLSGALTSFVTGVTEPLEFAFLFVAWPLFLIHAVLTGTSLALVNALGVRDGFGFSAGVIDYALNFTIATRPLWLLPIADPADRTGDGNGAGLARRQRDS